MVDLRHPCCDVCRATVPKTLMRFHRLWHESQGDPRAQFFDQDDDPNIAQVLEVVAVLRAVPPVLARAEFVENLRARLMAETLKTTPPSLSVVTAGSEGK